MKRFAVRQLFRSLERRLPRYGAAVAALGLAAGAVCALGSLSSDITRKMTREFRGQGPNAVARSRDGSPISPAAAARVSRAPEVTIAIPARVRDAEIGRRRALAVAIDFSRARSFTSTWSVDGRLPDRPDEAAVGTRLYDRLSLAHNAAIDVSVPEGRLHLRVVGRVSTGEGEDEELLLPIEALPGGVGAGAMLLRLKGEGSQVSREAADLEKRFGLRVDPLLAVSSSEGRVVTRLRGLLSALSIAVALLAALGTATTLLASVAQRRREIALEKSLGASARRLLARFLAEGIALGGLGGVLGVAAGLIAADGLERRLFGVSLHVSPIWILLPLLVALLVSALASIPPVRRVLAIEPIRALREE
jgi:putative ABC transport system permease protein